MYQTAAVVRMTLQMVLISSAMTVSSVPQSLSLGAIRKETDIIAPGNVMSRSRMSWLKLFANVRSIRS